MRGEKSRGREKEKQRGSVRIHPVSSVSIIEQFISLRPDSPHANTHLLYVFPTYGSVSTNRPFTGRPTVWSHGVKAAEATAAAWVDELASLFQPFPFRFQTPNAHLVSREDAETSGAICRSKACGIRNGHFK